MREGDTNLDDDLEALEVGLFGGEDLTDSVVAVATLFLTLLVAGTQRSGT
jgi:hypothetical protein